MLFSDDPKYGDKRVLLSPSAVADWSDRIMADIRYDERFNVLQYGLDEDLAVDTIITEDIRTYLEEDTVVPGEEDVDIEFTTGVNLGVAIRTAVDRYTDTDESRTALGDDILADVEDYEHPKDIQFSREIEEGFRDAVRAGYDAYPHLAALSQEGSYRIDLEDEGSILVVYGE